jgi:hypothetical protein
MTQMIFLIGICCGLHILHILTKNVFVVAMEVAVND